MPVDKLSDQHFDVVVVGGGLVGLSCALALNRQGMTVALVESRPRPQSVPDDATWDARIYAISPANATWLAAMGVWQRLDRQRFCPIAQMQIFGDTDAGFLQFDATEAHIDQLGFIIESGRLETALWAALDDSGVEVIDGVTPVAAGFDAEQPQLQLSDQRRLGAALMVAADGAASWLRREAGIAVQTHDYAQMGVVANFDTGLAHGGTAFQWFSAEGVLAWLPLPGNRISIVWSAQEQLARELLAQDALSFTERVAQKGGMKLGKLKLLTAAQAFPLRQQRADALVRPGLALVGDAAHTVHPLAGQGVNLGFRDVKTLAEVLAGRYHPQSFGDLMLLRRYERARKTDMMAMQSVTRGLSELFAHSQPLVRSVRNWGLRLTNQHTHIKKLLMQQATG